MTTRNRTTTLRLLPLSKKTKSSLARDNLKEQTRTRFFHELGTPSTDDMLAVIWMNLIRNNSITTEDVNLATKIFGQDISTIKGKTTRRKPLPVMDDSIDIPHELISVNEEAKLFMDGITVNSLKFLSTISENLYYRTAHYMPNTRTDKYRRAVNDVLSVYRQGGFQVTEIRCDNEFRATLDPIVANEKPPIHANYSNPQEHVPQAERNNRTIKERVRCTYHQLPFVHLPRILVKYLVIDAAIN